MRQCGTVNGFWTVESCAHVWPLDVQAALMVWLESGLRLGVSNEFLVVSQPPGSLRPA